MQQRSTPRPRVHVFLGISLDGYIADDNGDLSWLDACANESPSETGYEALMQLADTVLIGRTTYNTALSFDAWPYAGKQVVVMTNRPLLPRHGEQAWSGDLPDVLDCLAAGGAREIYLDGGQLVCQALRHALVDRLTLSWVPVVLGRGVRLFAEELPRSQWQLMGTRAFGSGLAQCRYQRVDR